MLKDADGVEFPGGRRDGERWGEGEEDKKTTSTGDAVKCRGRKTKIKAIIQLCCFYPRLHLLTLVFIWSCAGWLSTVPCEATTALSLCVALVLAHQCIWRGKRCSFIFPSYSHYSFADLEFTVKPEMSWWNRNTLFRIKLPSGAQPD